jgi:hypothetical protein
MRQTVFVLAILSVSCGAPGSSPVAPPDVSPGTYIGNDSAGQLQWTMQQAGPGQPVSGTGTFLATGATTPVSYTLRGTYGNDVLVVRLVGAPGDSDADSVWFNGRAMEELYAGAEFTGTLNGPTASLFGPLSMGLSGAPQ